MLAGMKKIMSTYTQSSLIDKQRLGMTLIELTITLLIVAFFISAMYNYFTNALQQKEVQKRYIKSITDTTASVSAIFHELKNIGFLTSSSNVILKCTDTELSFLKFDNNPLGEVIGINYDTKSVEIKCLKSIDTAEIVAFEGSTKAYNVKLSSCSKGSTSNISIIGNELPSDDIIGLLAYEVKTITYELQDGKLYRTVNNSKNSFLDGVDQLKFSCSNNIIHVELTVKTVNTYKNLTFSSDIFLRNM